MEGGKARSCGHPGEGGHGVNWVGQWRKLNPPPPPPLLSPRISLAHCLITAMLSHCHTCVTMCHNVLLFACRPLIGVRRHLPDAASALLPPASGQLLITGPACTSNAAGGSAQGQCPRPAAWWDSRR